MIAIDTNVLLRRLLADDAAQCLKVERALKPHAEILITDAVLAETLWTLSGKRYAASRDDIANTVMSLLEDPVMRLESNAAVWRALNDFLEFEKTDFQDALIARKSEFLGFERVLSFDKAAQLLPNVIPPA